MKYRIVYEKAAQNFSAYAPDLPGCAATAASLDECRRLMREGIDIYLDESAKAGEVREPANGYLEILDFPPPPRTRRRVGSAV